MKRVLLVSVVFLLTLSSAYASGIFEWRARRSAPPVVTQPPRPVPQPEEVVEPALDIVELARQDGRFTILLSALDRAGLTNVLKGVGPFTVLAPTDAAFRKYPQSTIDMVLSNPAMLRTVLTYHVAEGRVTAADARRLRTGTMINGEQITIAAAAGRVNNSNVVLTDIEASNGIIHVIDSVLEPPSLLTPAQVPTPTPTPRPVQQPTPRPTPSVAPAGPPANANLIELAEYDGRFTVLLAALDRAGLTATLRGAGPFTVLAPTDEAFSRIPQATVNAVLADPQLLRRVLLYHVTPGIITNDDVAGLSHGFMMNGSPVSLNTTATGTGLRINNDAAIMFPNVRASNGIVHVIDRVLVPPMETIGAMGAADPNFSLLAAAVEASGYGPYLFANGPYTILAPTNAAIEALAFANGVYSVDQAAKMLADDPSLLNQLQFVLAYHAFMGWGFSGDAAKISRAPAVSGEMVGISVENGRIMLNGTVRATITDILATNGVVHVLDGVLLPF